MISKTNSYEKWPIQRLEIKQKQKLMKILIRLSNIPNIAEIN